MKVLPPSPTLASRLCKKVGEQLTADWLKKAGADGQAVVDGLQEVDRHELSARLASPGLPGEAAGGTSGPLRPSRQAAATHSGCGFSTRFVEAGCFASMAGGRIGRAEKLPPQFGHRPPKRAVAQGAQKVHS